MYVHFVLVTFCLYLSIYKILDSCSIKICPKTIHFVIVNFVLTSVVCCIPTSHKLLRKGTYIASVYFYHSKVAVCL